MSSPVRQYQPIAQPPVRHGAVSEATKVEQSRAVAEVQAAVLVAQQNRRIKDIAISEMRDSTAQKSVAEKAFFRFPRSDGVVTGPSIHLARELARCWGNIQYGISELRRDDDKGESEMLAYAWDLETNAKNAMTFIVPHKRDTKQGARQLTDMRDIYENNANAGARRVRECIFAVLPAWFKDEASDRCRQTIEHGGGVPLPQRIANSIAAFEEIGISRKQLETKVGSASSAWNAHDLSQLLVIYTSIKNGEINKSEEFDEPAPSVSAASVRGRKPKPEPDPEVKDDESVAMGQAAEAASSSAASNESAKVEAPQVDASNPVGNQDAEQQKPSTSRSRKAPANPPATEPTIEQLTELSEVLESEGYDTTDKKVAYLSQQLKRGITRPNQVRPDEIDEIVGSIRSEQARDAKQQS